MSDLQRNLFKDCLKKKLMMAGRFEHELRAHDALHQLACILPTIWFFISRYNNVIQFGGESDWAR